MKRLPLTVKFMALAIGTKYLFEVGVQAYNVYVTLTEVAKQQQIKEKVVGFNTECVEEE